MSRKILQTSEIFERVELLRKQLDIGQQDFSKNIGISGSFYSEIKKGRSGFSLDFIINLFDLIRPLNPYWLFFGEQPQFLAPPRTGQPQNQVIVDLILRVSRLKPEKRQALIGIIEANLKLLEST